MKTSRDDCLSDVAGGAASGRRASARMNSKTETRGPRPRLQQTIGRAGARPGVGAPGYNRFDRALGFTLIELIGVLAIMAIIASVLVPNVLHSIELAAVNAEAQSVANMADQIKAYTRYQGVMPTSANWTNVIASYSELSPAALAQNRRARARVLLTDATTNRAMILSVMSANANLTLPGAVTAANFALIWNTVESTNNPSNWTGANWSAWQNVQNSEQLMVIQRINLSNELQTFPISLLNNSGSVMSYQIVRANGTTVGPNNLPSSAVPAFVNPAARVGDRVNLYKAAAGVTLNYTYLVSTTGKQIDYNTTTGNWEPH